MYRATICTLVVMLMLTVSGLAQIEISAIEVPHTVGTQFQYYSLSQDSIPVDLGTTGGPQVWDYTTGDTSTITTDLYLDPAQSPPEYERANVVIQTDQLSLFGLTDPGVMYCYLAQPRFIWGAVTTVYEGNEVGLTFQPYINQFILPMQYGMSWSNDIYVDEEYSFPDYDLRIEAHATMNSSIDAWGTVEVPLGSYESLRVRNDITYDMTIYIKFLWVWIPIYEDSGVATNYDWRAENVGTVLNITAQTANPNFEYADAIRRLMNSNTVSSSVTPFASTPATSPAAFELFANYPNPFNAQTTISYSLPRASDIDLRIYDLMGRQVAVLDQGYQSEGLHEVQWAPDDLSSGLYFAQLRVGDQVQHQMMVYLK